MIRLRFALECCQRCGEPLGMGSPAFGRSISEDEVVLGPDGERLWHIGYVYEHIEDCGGDVHA